MSDLFFRITGERAAWLDLSERGLVRLTGPDRVRFLDGMVTNSVSTLSTGDLCYAALLDRKGHLQSDLFVLTLEDEFLLDTAPGSHTRVAQVLERHVVADDVVVEDDSDRSGHISVEGPDARERLSQIGAPVPERGHVERSVWDRTPLVWVGRGSLSDPGVQVLGPKGAVRDLASALGLPEVPHDQSEILRVEAFLPRYGVDMTDRNFPAEARLDHAVSTTKGCYIGQEIVARIQSRGRVNRLLVKLRTDERVTPGTPICVEGVREGEVTSAVVSSASGPLALGYVRTAHARPGLELRVGESRGVVVGPPQDESRADP
jgi:folate-binding protein YgfZ